MSENTATLENLKPGEKVEKVIRRHWIVYVMVGVYALGGLMLTVVIFSIF